MSSLFKVGFRDITDMTGYVVIVEGWFQIFYRKNRRCPHCWRLVLEILQIGQEKSSLLRVSFRDYTDRMGKVVIVKCWFQRFYRYDRICRHCWGPVSEITIVGQEMSLLLRVGIRDYTDRTGEVVIVDGWFKRLRR